jgi:hypothetical protein
MKFSDNIERTNLELVFVERTRKDMESREEINTFLWDVERFDVKKTNKDGFVCLYKTPCRDVRLGELIYNKQGEAIAYRSA